MKTPQWIALPMVLALCVTACAGDEMSSDDNTITVMASWTGDEAKAFRAVLERFTSETGTEVIYHGTRDVDQVLRANVQKATPPDIAVLPNIGELAEYAAQGKLHGVPGRYVSPSDYSEQWQERIKWAGTNEIYAVPIKADLKGIVWFNPRELRTPPEPRTWEQLLELSHSLSSDGTPAWCVGMGAPPASGWPGTDWIEDILLYQAGPESYQDLIDGDLPWTSEVVENAWRAWGLIVGAPELTSGGRRGLLLTDFSAAGSPMFASKPGCSLQHEGSFITSAYDNVRKEGVDYDFFPFPGMGEDRWTMSADMAGLFTDSEQARNLLGFLASERFPELWPGTFSVNTTVDDAGYDAVEKKIVGALRSDAALCFNASDLMPPTVRKAFYRATLEFINDPGRLDSLLAGLDTIASDAKSSGGTIGPDGRVSACGP